MAVTPEKIRVKKGWDLTWSQAILGEVKPLFIGRSKELDRIKTFIRSKRQGALFIGGENGSGKTSTVLKALDDLDQDIDIYSLKLNYIFLEGDNNKQTTISLIKQLIRALYTKLEEEKITKKIPDLEQLYKDVNATKLRVSEEEKTRSVWENQILIKDVAINIGSVLLSVSGAVTLAISGITRITSTEIYPFLFKSLLGLLEIVLSICGFTYTKSREKSNNRQAEVEGLSIHELQNRTGNILKKVKQVTRKQKIVILFDELDHYDYAENNQKQGACDTKTLLLTLKGLKLLFQNVSASFIFLIGEKTYEEMNSNPYLTIATDRFFLAKASPVELNEFVLEVFENPSNEQREWLKTYCALKIWESRGNFYKLIASLRDDFEYSEKKLILRTKNMSHAEEVTAVLIQAAFRFLTSFSQPLSKGATNDEIFNGLMSVVDNYYKSIQGNSEKFVITSSSRMIESAVTSYISYIFETAKKLDPNIVIPLYEKSKKAYSDLEWAGIQNLSEPGILVREITKAVLPEEKDVEGIYRETSANLEFLSDKLNLKKTDDIVKSVQEVSEATLIPETPSISYAKELSDAYKTISTIPFQQRPADFRQSLASKVIPAGSNLQKLLTQKYFFQDANPLVVRRVDPLNVYNSNNPGGDTLILELGKRQHRSGVEFSSFATIAHPLPANKFTIKFEAYMQPDSILDVVFGTTPWTEEASRREFLMVRLDTRDGSKDGIFYKSSAQPAWHGMAASKKGTHTAPLNDVLFWIRLNNKKISLNKPRWNSIIAEERINKIYWWGIANELNEVELTLYTDTLPNLS